MPAAPAAIDPLRSLKIVVATMALALPVMGVALSVALPEGDASSPVAYLVAGLPVVTGLVALWLGSQVPRLPVASAPQEATAGAWAALRSRAILACAVAESGALLGVVLAFVVGAPAWLVGVGLAIGAVFVLLAGWPTRGRLQAYERALNDQGHRVRLAD